MNINNLRPRVFYDGEMWQVEKICFKTNCMWLQNKNWERRVFEVYQNFKIDRPVGMIKDRYGKEMILHEKDILRVFTHIDEKEPELNDFEDVVIIWCGDMNSYQNYFAFEAFPREDVDYNYIASIFNDSEYVGVEIIGNVHENPDLAPDWWKHKNANSQ